MKVAVIGANGQLGSDIFKILKNNFQDVFPLTHDDIEVSNIDSVRNALLSIKPEFIINTSAFHNVPLCEKEPEKAYLVNVKGVENLSTISNEINATLIHFSTDYVFDGEKRTPYIEDDKPNPLNVYAKTKLEGELKIKEIAEKYYILRVAGLYGETPSRVKGYNFVTLMLKLSKEKDELRVVDDEFTTPTWTKEIALQVLKIIEELPPFRLYHATAEGECSWFEFAKEIFNIAGMDVNLKPALAGEFSTEVKRPKYSVLENKFLKEYKINIFRHWKEELRDYLEIIL